MSLVSVRPVTIAPGVVLLLEKELNLDTKVHSITKEERRKIVDTLKGLPISAGARMIL